MKNSFYLSVFAPLLALLASTAFAAPAETEFPDHKPGEVIVKLQGSFDTESRAENARSVVAQSLIQELGSDAIQDMHPFVTDPSLAVVRLKSDRLAMSALETLRRQPGVAYAEYNYIYHALVMPSDNSGIPNDPDFAKSWSLYNTGQADYLNQVGIAGIDVNVLPLWKKGITGDKNVIVAVIDTGISWTNPNLIPNLYTNPGNVHGDTFKDDIHGWSFAENGNDTNDGNGHGSHCAGIIGAAGNQGLGIAGVNWNVSLLPIQYLDYQGHGDVEGAVNSINYARMMKVKVMSNSWGGTQFSQAIHDAIQSAANDGILFVAAAGNDGADDDDTDNAIYPAAYDVPNIIAVAAIDNQGSLANFSDYGLHKVHVGAPGVDIWSTWRLQGYQDLSGTSMAAPHVSGVAALLMSANPSWTYAEVKDRIVKTATPLASLHGRTVSGGMVNATNAYYDIIPPNNGPAENRWLAKAQDVESPHPYANSSNQTWTVSVPGAKYIRVHFATIKTENFYDLVTVETTAGKVIDTLSGEVLDYSSEYFEGDSLVIRLTADQSNNDWGIQIDKVEYIMK